MEQELSQGVSAVKNLTAAVFESGTSFQSLVGNISAVGFAAKLHILGVAMQALGSLASVFKGLFESMTNTENQLVRIGTSLRGMGRDANKAGDIFEQAMDKAAETPFDLQQVLHSVTQLGGYGVAALDTLKKKNGEVIRDIRGLPVTLIDALGNVAGATGMSLDRTMEAYADAIMGEWERMKQFGIKKEMIPGLAALQAGTPEYKRLIAEWMATSERFAGGMFKQSRTIAGMMSNFGDVFTRFGIEVGGTANQNIKTNSESLARKGSKDVMGKIASGETTSAQVIKDYKVNPAAFDGVIAGSKEYNKRLELAIRYSSKLAEETDGIATAGTLYDAVRISVRQLYEAFGDSSKGISYLGTALGQWLKQFWVTFIYPIFTALADFFRWLGKAGEDMMMGFSKHAQIAGEKVSDIGLRQRTMVETIGMMWGVFLSFWWNPLVKAITAVIGWIGEMFFMFNSGFTASSKHASMFDKILEDVGAVGKDLYGLFQGLFAILGEVWGIFSRTGVFHNFFGMLGRIASVIWDNIIGGWRAMIAFVGGFVSAFWDAVKPAVEYISSAFSGLFQAINEVFDSIFGNDSMKSFWEFLKGVFSVIGKILGFIIGTVFKVIGFAIGLIIDGIKWLIKGIGWVINGIIAAGKWVWDALGPAFKWVGEKISTYIIEPLKAIGGFFSAVFDGIMAGITRSLNFIREHMPGMDSRGKATATSALEAISRNDITMTEKGAQVKSAFGSFSGAGRDKFNQAIAEFALQNEAGIQAKIPEFQRAANELATGGDTVITLNVGGKKTKFKITGATGNVEETK